MGKLLLSLFLILLLVGGVFAFFWIKANVGNIVTAAVVVKEGDKDKVLVNVSAQVEDVSKKFEAVKEALKK
ncbi:MAG: hypothetical protein AABY26_03185 [Nanoarchaeota archaeon]